MKVLLHRIALGGSIRATIDGGAASYLTEEETRERLFQTGGITLEQVDGIIAGLSSGRGEHVLSFENPGPDLEGELRETWTGSPEPAEISGP